MNAGRTVLGEQDARQAPPRFDTLVLGLGKTGMSCVRHLAARGERLGAADSRQAPPELPSLQREYPQIPFFPGEFDAALLRRARRLVISPGVPPAHKAIRAALAGGADLSGDVELFCRDLAAPLLAVTGSNGKSTVASLLADMLARAGRRVGLGGNIGRPALELLRDPAPDYCVLELSSFQLETLRSHRPAAAAVLNVSADHQDRHRSMEDYARVKENIYAGDGAMIINLDDAVVAAMARSDRRRITFSLARDDADFSVVPHAGETWLVSGRERLLPASRLHIRGAHNLANALAALAFGRAVDLPTAPMLEALCAFAGLPHRCEWVAERGGVAWFNDSKATNVGAALAALRGLAPDPAGNIHLVAGGAGKGADFSPLSDALRGRVKSLLLMGDSARQIAATAPPDVAPVYVDGMEEAVAAAARRAAPGDIVLLSPACAGTDMFEDYAARGEAFKRCVAAALEGGAP